MRLNSQTAYVLWLGSQESFDQYEAAYRQLEALEAQGPEAIKLKVMSVRGGGLMDSLEMPPLYTVKDGLAILNIEGPLMSGNAGFMQLFGVLGYDDIKQAAREIAADPKIKSVLQINNSPGGMAAGCEECANVLHDLAAAKPLTAYTDMVMASGGYWLGSTASRILTAKTSTLGSVGVIATHTDYSKMYEKEGITKTVVRAGEFKQLANQNEPLSDAGKAHLKAMAEAMYSVFADGVSSSLGVTREKFDATMGRGREFMGQAAVDVGLAHQVATYDEAVAIAKKVDMPKLSRQNSRNAKGVSNMKATLSTGLILAIYSGAAVATLDFSAATATAEGVAPDAEGQQFLRAQAVELEAGVKKAQEVTVAAATTPLTAKITELTASLSTVSVERDALKLTQAAVTDKAQKLEASVVACEKVLCSAINCMQVALGGKETDITLKGVELVAEHTRIEAEFAKKFPTGKVSVMTTETEKTKPGASKGLPDFALIARRQSEARAKA